MFQEKNKKCLGVRINGEKEENMKRKIMKFFV